MRTAEHDPTTPTPLPVTERALAIPHALTPEEVAALIRVGENLANISERLTAMMGRNGGPLAGELRAFVHEVFVTLDRSDGDPELEEGCDEEPALGWTLGGLTASGNDRHNVDLEDDPADRDSDADVEEGWHQPVRLDVALQREGVAHV